jgi:hypothetical protein
LRTTYFQVVSTERWHAYGWHSIAYRQQHLQEHFGKLALDLAQYKPSLTLWYVEDIVVWPHGPE